MITKTFIQYFWKMPQKVRYPTITLN
ncbi:hypothetical protein BCEN4_740030 [Burkholderia cenocepacia]|nr:hypothetical protein BCEN4_740030 [Burkholderia cenocepacia]